MNPTYMAIDKNITMHETERKNWDKRGIDDIRVDTITEGINMALLKRFLFIAVNADNIKDYMTLLPALRKATNGKIIIGTSNFSVEEQSEAMRKGADFYGKLGESDDNMKIAMALIDASCECTGQQRESEKVIVCGNMVVFTDYHKIFIDEVELALTTMETKVLSYLATNRGHILGYEQIQDKIRCVSRNGTPIDNLYSIIKRLRKKLKEVSPLEYIETIIDVGYRFKVSF